jgi:hypothetical protein
MRYYSTPKSIQYFFDVLVVGAGVFRQLGNVGGKNGVTGRAE